MDNIISLIERLGADSRMRENISAKPEQHLIANSLVQQWLVGGNVSELEKVLNARNKIVCIISPPEPEQQPDEDDDEEEKEKENNTDRALVSNG